MAGKRRARMVSGLSRGPMKKAPKERRKELWGASAAGPEQLPGHELHLESSWRRFVGVCTCGQFALLSKRNHIVAAYRRHLAVAGGYARRDRMEQAVGLRKKAHWLVLKTSPSGAWRVDCHCGWRSPVAASREPVIQAARGHLAAAERARSAAAAVRSSQRPTRAAQRERRRKSVVVPEPSRAEQIRTRRLQELRIASNSGRTPKTS
jgi:hypothetical protein